MPDENGVLTTADIPIIHAFMQRNSPDMCLTCPVTGGRVPITHWQINNRLLMLPNSGVHLQADMALMSPFLSCMSPAGGMIFLSATHVGLVVQATAH